MTAFSCFLIGSDTLLPECGEVLLREGHEVRGVVTATPRLAAWARSKKIPVLDPKQDYKKTLAEQPFDYLFSITYLSIIPADVLALAKKGAINFHDGPLPRYAGLNTPVWGLINRETTWGITFHWMTAGIDKGDILKQKLFEVAPGETALSLNTRCFATAIEAFNELVPELANGTVKPVPQDTADRMYFSKHQRPAAACVLDFSKPAVELDALVRALDFGRYQNPVGSAKVAIDGRALIVTRSQVREDEEGDPGAVIAADDKEILVGTSEGAIALLGFQTLGGRDLSLKEVGIEAGATFDPVAVEPLTNVQASVAKSEEWWAKRISLLEPLELPTATAAGSSSSSSDAPRYERISLRIPDPFRAKFVARLSDAVFGAFAVQLARITAKDELDLSFADGALARELGEAAKFVSTEVPIHVALESAWSFEAAIEKINAGLAEARSKRSFLRDTIARYPELHARAEFVAGKLLAVGAAIVDAPDTFTPARPASLILAIAADGANASLIYDANVLSQTAASELRDQLVNVLISAAEAPSKAISALELMSEADKQKVLVEWNKTEAPYRTDACVHQLIEEQAAKTPNAPAIVFEASTLTYRELNARANQLAAHLKKLGVGPDKLVGIYVERSLDLMVATLGAQKAGGAYLPLDPAYPKERIQFMIEDSKVEVIVAQERLVPDLPASKASVVRVDADWSEIAKNGTENVRGDVTPSNLAYVIYTSGSTGKPKGVQVEHRNVANFFSGMDERLPKDQEPGTWLAVTSLSFDIHVLELFWTLARGFKVVVYLDRDRGQATKMLPKTISTKSMQFGLFMWGNDDAPGRQKYDLLLKGAKFFDDHNFDSVWTPERHFHAFGGPYPNPSVTGAAVAAITSRVKIRAGSCVSPLHHPIRIAEEWSIIDNLSDGRVGLSFASGWQPNDFVLQPQNHKNAKNVMLEQIETVRKLWRGEAIEFTNPMGQKVPIVTLPRPVQKELPFWVTTAGNPATYKEAGYIGANVLTHLLGQSVEEVAGKIKIYREARAEKGLDPATGHVTLMLHTFVGWDIEDVRKLVRQPMKDYLGASVSLVKNFAWAFPAFKRPQGENAKPDDIDLSSLTKEELDGILEFAFERYFETSGLFGTPESCMEMVNKLKQIGVDEIACLLDFGVATAKVIESLPQLNKLREMANADVGKSDDELQDFSIAAQIKRHRVTHMQCTPSMARMMLMHDESREALRAVKHVFVGGEAFPVVLAKELGEVVGSVTNMYGPTETTIWSSTHPVKGAPDSIPIGRPIANTQFYVLDKNRQPMPAGVPGELYIGGAGVVRGYLFRPELTSERFVENSFHGGRMYRTGDLAKFRRDGVMEFLGRTDHQVKIRGYRIELGEIETLLSKHAAVRECVVVLREDTPGDQRLVGYYVAHAAPAAEADLKDWMRAKLPEYMVPSHFAALDAMPLTPNGKIDRKQLPALETLGAKASAVEYVAPENEVEEKIAKIWMETLNKEKVGIEDNFFDIGGHSLLVVRMHRKIKDVLEKPVSLTDLYRFPTIRSFSEFLSSDGSSEAVRAGTDRAARRRDLLAKRRRRT